MKKICIALSVIILVGGSCSKNNTPSPGGGSATTQSTTNTSNGFPTSGTNSINGVLVIGHVNVPALSVSQYYQGRATFSSAAKSFSSMYTTYGIIFSGESVGTLKLDSNTLVYYPSSSSTNPNTYADTANNPSYPTVKWSIGGNANFTAFSTTVTRGYPAIANLNYLPATLSKSQALTINFGSNNYTNTDSLVVMIFDNASTNPAAAFKYVAGNAASVTFSPAELSALSTSSQNSEIVVYGKNFSNLTNSGKNYVFILQNDVIKFITITP